LAFISKNKDTNTDHHLSSTFFRVQLKFALMIRP